MVVLGQDEGNQTNFARISPDFDEVMLDPLASPQHLFSETVSRGGIFSETFSPRHGPLSASGMRKQQMNQINAMRGGFTTEGMCTDRFSFEQQPIMTLVNSPLNTSLEDSFGTTDSLFGATTIGQFGIDRSRES